MCLGDRQSADRSPRRIHRGEPTTASGPGLAITGIAADTLAINPSPAPRRHTPGWLPSTGGDQSKPRVTAPTAQPAMPTLPLRRSAQSAIRSGH
jgi:hypothetical protein